MSSQVRVSADPETFLLPYLMPSDLIQGSPLGSESGLKPAKQCIFLHLENFQWPQWPANPGCAQLHSGTPWLTFIGFSCLNQWGSPKPGD